MFKFAKILKAERLISLLNATRESHIPLLTEFAAPFMAVMTAGKARAAVVDKNVALDTSRYEKKYVAKDENVRAMLTAVINAHVLFRYLLFGKNRMTMLEHTS